MDKIKDYDDEGEYYQENSVMRMFRNIDCTIFFFSFLHSLFMKILIQARLSLYENGCVY